MMMINYRQLDEGFRRMIEGQKRCEEFVSFLTNNNRKRMGDYDNEREDRLIRVDETQVQSCGVTIISSAQHNKLPSYNSPLISPTNNDYIPDDSYSQQQSRSSFNKVIQQQPLSQMNQQGSQLDEDEYFEMEIVLDGLNGSESHQVKMYQAERHRNPALAYKRSLSTSNQCFNLSNFSSFNNNNHNRPNNGLPNLSTTSQLQQERSFYSQQLCYLIKKIQFIHGRKLSTKGVAKIIDSLYLMTRGGFGDNSLNRVECHSDQCNEVEFNDKGYDDDIVILKDITINSQNVVPSRAKAKINQPLKTLSSNYNNYKKISFTTQPQSQPKTKSKLINKICPSKNQANKQNQNFPSVLKQNKTNKTQKQPTKGKQRSVSPLSYRVLMQKKKLLQKQQKPPLNQQKIHEHHSGQSLPQSYQSSFTKPFGSKPHCLKIILQKMHFNQNSSKTLSFQCHLDAHKPFQIKKQIQRYCEENMINKTNINIIMQALTQRRPIITIKSKGSQ